jgi:hypothetical protein
MGSKVDNRVKSILLFLLLNSLILGPLAEANDTTFLSLFDSEKAAKTGVSLDSFIKHASCSITKIEIGEFTHTNKPTKDVVYAICAPTKTIDVAHLVWFTFLNEKMTDVELYVPLTASLAVLKESLLRDWRSPKDINSWNEKLSSNIKAEYERGGRKKTFYSTKPYPGLKKLNLSKLTFRSFYNGLRMGSSKGVKIQEVTPFKAFLAKKEQSVSIFFTRGKDLLTLFFFNPAAGAKDGDPFMKVHFLKMKD